MKQFNIGIIHLNNDLITVIFMHQHEGFINLKYPQHVYQLLKCFLDLNKLADFAIIHLMFFRSCMISLPRTVIVAYIIA